MDYMVPGLLSSDLANAASRLFGKSLELSFEDLEDLVLDPYFE
jgi:hypothetical protein